ncbi:MAG TPA: ABC transporter ATP-binding protein [Candidatus Deferrimicrobiaceae bacterium]|jgi:branched-chain amino acid transport system ATP-binding protein|nr:ABC transporter ATP-binding protein [Candidatus Deferrimicrobiaceae bacterium]
MLRLSGLSVSYGGLRALEDVSLEVNEGEFVAIVGPNGAGKTTLLKAISGSARVGGGRLEYRGRDLTPLPPHQRAALGIAHVPEGRRIFPSLTVMENLELGSYRRAARGRRAEGLESVMTLFPVLQERRQQAAGSLSGGEQQMLALGRGLMAAPELLLLDEPSQGLAPRIVEQIFETIDRIRRASNLTILLVEQRVVEALELCDRGYVLETGRVALEGTHAALLADPRVQRAYLGA